MAKQFAKVSYSVFEDAAKKLQISEPILAEEIGYHRNAHNHWKVSGLMPKVASVAVEGILRRNNKSCTDHKTLVVKLPNDKMDALVSVLSAFNCTYQEV